MGAELASGVLSNLSYFSDEYAAVLAIPLAIAAFGTLIYLVMAAVKR